MILYKYFPFDQNTIKSLANNGLWCHFPSKMNDPFECLSMLDVRFSDSTLNEFRIFCKSAKSSLLTKLKDVTDNEIQNYINALRRKFISEFAFCSLSENPLDIKMWSHYSNSHKGIVVGFEFEDLNNGSVFQKVNYKDKLDEFRLLDWGKLIEGSNELLPVFLKDISIKSSAWKAESEWRIWRDQPSYYYYKRTEIKELYFGIRCEEDSKRIIAKLIDLPEDVIIYELEIDRDSLSLKK